jgi:YesN/AraC family two-component response regulator
MTTMEHKPLSNLKRLSLVIADDVKETRRAARLMVTLLPTVEVVGVAQNGREAVELVQKVKPDMVLIDINMPEMDGLTAIRTLLKYRPDTACVIMSAQGDSRTMQEAIDAGARGYLVKPFTTEELVQTMKRVISSLGESGPDAEEVVKLRRQRDAYLLELAGEYVRARRTDEKARQILEILATDPNCEPQWLMALAMIYMSRRRWADLAQVAGRLAKIAPSPRKGETA